MPIQEKIVIKPAEEEETTDIFMKFIIYKNVKMALGEVKMIV